MAFSRSFPVPILQRRRDFGVRHCSQRPDPGLENGFIGAARFDAFASAVRDATGRLVQEQGLVRDAPGLLTRPGIFQKLRYDPVWRRLPGNASGYRKRPPRGCGIPGSRISARRGKPSARKVADCPICGYAHKANESRVKALSTGVAILSRSEARRNRRPFVANCNILGS